VLTDETQAWRTLRAIKPRMPADELLRMFSITTPAVPVEGMVQTMGIDLYEEWIGAAGEADSRGERAIIRVNKGDHIVRQRFTIAHELGHLLWHPLGVQHRDPDFSRWEPIEMEANNFAAELLMPEWMVRPATAVAESVEQLARMFEVSTPAMKFRLKNLRIYL
jgi:Zn-dependent peptidase ImmA (M78 family)